MKNENNSYKPEPQSVKGGVFYTPIDNLSPTPQPITEPSDNQFGFATQPDNLVIETRTEQQEQVEVNQND